jgi:hypothetical protein
MNLRGFEPHPIRLSLPPLLLRSGGENHFAEMMAAPVKKVSPDDNQPGWCVGQTGGRELAILH